jgi:hypothetical protein
MSVDLREDVETIDSPRIAERALIIAWAVIGLGAAAIRLLLLDRMPLSEPEAAYAIQAWDAARGILDTSLASTGAPLLLHLMTGLFFVFGPSDAATRVVPALAGAALAISPALLMATIGRRAAFCTGLLLAVSPVAVQVSRMADPAALTAAFVLLIVASLIRLATDRPRWAPWVLAASLGLALANEASVVIGLVTAALAAAATWGWSPRRWLVDTGERMARGELAAARGPVALAIGTMIVAATGVGMDLTGAGFGLGELWGGAARILAPAPFPTRNLAANLVYTWPVLALAAVAFVRGVRAGDRLALFLGQWMLLLLALSAVVGQSALSLAILPVLPAAVLAGMAISDLTPETVRLPSNGLAYGGALLLLALVGAVVIVFGYSVGANRGLPSWQMFLGLGALTAVVAVAWWELVKAEQVGPALGVLAVVGFCALTVGAIARLSYGGSPLASEPLPREMTHPAIREVFQELTVLASADPARMLVVDAKTPAVIRWYGRYIQTVTAARPMPARPILTREATGEGSTASGLPLRTPLRIVSVLNRAELSPMAAARWAVARANLVQAKPSDIIISR